MGGRAKRPSYAELAAIVVELRAEVLQLKTRIVELEHELEKKNPTPRLDESYSVKAEEKRRQREEEQKSGKSRPHGSHGDQQASERRGRKPSQEKIDEANVLNWFFRKASIGRNADLRLIDRCGEFEMEKPSWLCMKSTVARMANKARSTAFSR